MLSQTQLLKKKAVLGEHLEYFIIIPMIAFIVFAVVMVANASLGKVLETDYLEERLLIEQAIESLGYKDPVTGFIQPNSIDISSFRDETLQQYNDTIIFHITLTPLDSSRETIEIYSDKPKYEDAYPLRGLTYLIITKKKTMTAVHGNEEYPAVIEVRLLFPKKQAHNIEDVE